MDATGKITKIAGGKIIEIANKDIIYSSGNNIIQNASINVKQIGNINGVVYDTYTTEMSGIDNAFLPIVNVETSNDKYDVQDYVDINGNTNDGNILSKNLGQSEKNSYRVKLIKLKNSITKQKIKFSVRKGHPNANDSDGGNIYAYFYDKNGNRIEKHTQKFENKKYGDSFELDIDTSLDYDKILFDGEDNDAVFDGGYGKNYCGRVMIFKCYCNIGFSEEDIKYIVTQLRKKEIISKNNKVIRDHKGVPVLKNGKKQYTDRTTYDDLQEKIFHLDYPEKINSTQTNFKSFAKALNKTFAKYEINTCIRKIHFLAQCYHETQRFSITYEKSPRSTVSGGAFYRGRGLIQLTHDYNYKKLLSYLKSKDALSIFVPRVAKEIDLACLASGYYWKYIGAYKGNISQFADKDDVLTVSREINGYVTTPYGFEERKKFTNILKQVFLYEKCVNNTK